MIGTSGEAAPDALLQSIYVERREQPRGYVSNQGLSLRALKRGVSAPDTHGFRPQVEELLTALIDGVGRLASSEYFRLSCEESPKQSPLRILVESFRQERGLAGVCARVLCQPQINTLSQILARQVNAPLDAAMTLVTQAGVGSELKQVLEKIVRDYLQGDQSMAQAQAAFQRNASAVQDQEARVCLLAAEKLVFSGTYARRREGLGDWVGVGINQVKVLGVSTGNIYEALGSYQYGLVARQTAALLKQERPSKGSPAAALAGSMEALQSLLQAALEPSFLAQLVAKKSSQEDAVLAKGLLERLSSAYASLPRRAIQGLLGRAAGRLLDIDAAMTLQRVAEIAKYVLDCSFEARGDLKTRRSNLDLLKRLDEYEDARHEAVPLSEEREDSHYYEKRYFKKILPTLEALFPERDLIYTLYCSLIFGELPDPSESSWAHSSSRFFASLSRTQLEELLAEQFSASIDAMTSNTAINEALVAFVKNGLPEGVSRDQFFEELALLPEDDSMESLYRRARLATLYIPCILNGTEDGLQHKLLAYTFVQLHHLLQFRPFAKNLLFHILDVLLRTIDGVTLPSKGPLQESSALAAIPLRPAENETDEKALDSCVDLLAYLFTHGTAEMGEAGGWLDWKSWAAPLVGATVESETVKAQIRPQVQACFGSLWPLRSESILTSVFASLEQTLRAGFKERVAQLRELMLSKETR